MQKTLFQTQDAIVRQRHTQTPFQQFAAQGSGVGESADGIRQILIGARIPGKKMSDARQHRTQIKIIEPFPDSGPPRAEFKDAQPAARNKHTQDFPVGIGPGHDVADAEGDGHGIHAGIGQGQGAAVGLYRQGGSLPRPGAEHGPGKIHGQHAGLRALVENFPAHILSARRQSAGSEERRVGKECRSRWSPYH